MQQDDATPDKVEKPRWRRIVDYPLVAMVVAVVINILATALGVGLDKLVPPLGRSGSAVADAFLVIIPAYISYKLIIVRLGDHPRDDLVWNSSAPKKLALGLAVGFLIMAVVVAVAAIFGVYRIVGVGDASRLVIELAMVAIIPGFTEELLFRGILFRFLEDWGGSWAGLVLSSLAFGFAHYFNPNSSVLACLWIAIEAGLLLGGAYMLTRSLWFPMGLHAAWNLTQGEIFDVPVSGIDEHGVVQAKISGPTLLTGGQFGLEASILALVVATAAGVWIVWLSVKRGQLVEPRWVRRRREAAAA